MRPPERRKIILLAALFWAGPTSSGAIAGQKDNADTTRPGRPQLEMSKAVACKRIEGYEQIVPLPDASLTSEDKLQVYYRPLNFKVDPVEKPKPGHRYKAKFSQDSRIRKKGDKVVLMKKDKLLEYDPSFETPYERLYLMNNIGLKGLPPGDYELDIILHDDLDEGSSATQSLPFTIIPTPKFDPPPKIEGPDEPEGPTGPARDPKTPKTSKTKP